MYEKYSVLYLPLTVRAFLILSFLLGFSASVYYTSATFEMPTTGFISA
jgi:hypothetical protein